MPCCSPSGDLYRYYPAVERSGDPTPASQRSNVLQRNRVAGEVLGAGGDLPYVGGNWNDRISSVHVPAGRTVVLHEHADYGGNSFDAVGDEADLRVFPGPSLDGTWKTSPAPFGSSERRIRRAMRFRGVAMFGVVGLGLAAGGPRRNRVAGGRHRVSPPCRFTRSLAGAFLQPTNRRSIS